LSSCTPNKISKSNELSKKSLSPDEVLKLVLDDGVRGNYDAMFPYFVDGNGNSISQETKKQVKDSLERAPMASYSIKETADVSSSSPEYSTIRNTAFTQAKIVLFSVIIKNTQSVQENKFIFVQSQGSWKILLPSSPPAQNPQPATNIPSQQIANDQSVTQQAQQAVSLPVSSEARTNYIGLWRAEKIFAYDQSSQQYKEGTLTTELYFEYTADARWCVMWSLPLAKCLKYDTYMVADDVITQHQEGLTGPQSRYRWKIVNHKMELASEISLNGAWQSFIKYSLVPVSYPTASQSAATSGSSPKIVSLTSNPSTAKPGQSVSIVCHVTDNEGVTSVEMSYTSPAASGFPKPLYPGISGTITDRTYTTVHADQDAGTYTVYCEATNTKLNKSPKVQATYQIVG